MKFELNEYHRNITNKELLDDVKKTAYSLSKSSITIKEYNDNGKYNFSTLQRRFGSWKKILVLSGLEIEGHNFAYNFTDEELIKDIHYVAELLNKRTITLAEYNKYGKFHSKALIRKYSTWNNVLQLAKMEVNFNMNISSEELLQEIERIWILLGRQPTTTDIKNGISKYSLQSYSRRFGGWRGALEAFIEWINEDESETENIIKETKINQKQLVKKELNNHKTKRDVNYRLRFRVMQRDNFKCCMCGASPAKDDPSVVLHIDHIIPWSKGGETTFDNLQTLCSKCNLGKSDLF